MDWFETTDINMSYKVILALPYLLSQLSIRHNDHLETILLRSIDKYRSSSQYTQKWLCPPQVVTLSIQMYFGNKENYNAVICVSSADGVGFQICCWFRRCIDCIGLWSEHKEQYKLEWGRLWIEKLALACGTLTIYTCTSGYVSRVTHNNGIFDLTASAK